MRRPRWIALLALSSALGCRPRPPAPPAVEFLVLAGDSTYWVRSTATGLRVRGSPIQLARFGGRFYEIYLADDDRSYETATFVGARIYRRDLLTGDSLLVFNDTTIALMASEYGRAHPDARPLEPDDDPAEDPDIEATSDISVLAQHGAYLSYEYRADATPADDDATHIVRRGVVDLRDGDPASLASLFGAPEAKRVLAQGAQLFRQAMDSVRASRDSRARAARQSLADFAFDSASFSLVPDDRTPEVEFLAPGHGPEVGGFALTLSPIEVAKPAWWREVEEALPESADARGTESWTHAGMSVLARETGDGDGASLALVDSIHRRWSAGRIAAPVWRVYWLRPAGVDSATIRALARAFDDAVLYADDARTTAFHRPHHRHRRDVRLARASRLPNVHSTHALQ